MRPVRCVMLASRSISLSRFSPSGVSSYTHENTSVGMKPIKTSANRPFDTAFGSSSICTTSDPACSTSQLTAT